MGRMFGERITEFLLAIDIMDEETFTELMKVNQHYVNEHLDVAYFSVLDETIVNNHQACERSGPRGKHRSSQRLFRGRI